MSEEADPGFRGRERELGELLGTFRSARSGNAQAVLLRGDAGVGKSRLVGELIRHARQHRATVLVGTAIDIADAPPFWPVISALRNAARADPDSEASARVRRWLAQRPSATDAAPRTPVRLLDELHQLIIELAELTALVLVIEDLHWADRSTRDLLVYLIANLGHEPVLVVGTYRSDSPGSTADLTAALAELRRHKKVSGLELRPLGRAALADLLAQWAPARPDLEPLMWRRSAGNAFIAEETVRAVLAGDARGLPSTLREVVLSRIALLSPPAQQVVRAVAASVGPLPHPLLADVLDQSPATLLEAVREAAAHGIVRVDEHSDGYGLRHGLMAEVVAADLLPGERIDLHRRYALALTRSAEAAQPGLAAQLAHHWYEAGDQENALVATVEAAKASEGVHAHAETYRHWLRAAELARLVPGAGGVHRLECLDRAARAADLAGDHEQAVELWQRLLDDPETAGGLQCALFTARKGSSLAAAGRLQDAGETYRVAASLLPESGAEAERAQVLSGYGAALLQATDFAGARTVALQALDLARSAGSSTVEAKILAVLGFAQAYLEDAAAGSAAIAEALAVAEQTGEPEALGQAYLRRVELLAGPLNQLAEGIEFARSGFERMRLLGLARTAGVALLTHAGNALFRLGNWADAQRTVAQAWSLGPTGTTAIEVRLARVRLDLAGGRLDAADDDLGAIELLVRATAGPRHRIPLLTLRAALELWRRRPDAALRYVEDGLDVAEAGDDDIWSVAPLVWHGTRAWADAAAAGLPPLSAAQVQRLRRHTAELERRGRHTVPAVRRVIEAFCLTCAAEAARAGNEPDPSAWEQVAQRWEVLNHPYPAAYARLRHAEALLTIRARSTAAADALREAERVARRLGAEPLLAEVVDLAGRARIPLDPQLSPEPEVPEPSTASPGPLDMLTARELEVLTELTAGLTNRQIGSRLYISEKTVSIHLSRIFAKLGVHTRVQASAVLSRSRAPSDRP